MEKLFIWRKWSVLRVRGGYLRETGLESIFGTGSSHAIYRLGSEAPHLDHSTFLTLLQLSFKRLETIEDCLDDGGERSRA